MKRIGRGRFALNFLVQRLLGLNKDFPLQVDFTTRIGCADQIKFSPDLITMLSFATSGGCYFQALNGIIIGRNFLFAPGIKVISADHDFTNFERHQSGSPIVIGNDVWIGTNAVVLPGVTIEDRCIIGAGAIVTKSIKEGSIAAGNPAKVIGVRNG